jgi:Leucine-rich repeat (LRR) protein
LNLCNNCLTKLPYEIRHLYNLKDLDISDNRFSEVPRILSDLNISVSF